MKLTPATVKILENFSSINPGIIIRATKDDKTEVKTVSIARTMFANTLIEETVDKDIRLGDLHGFLGIVSSFEDVDIDLHDNHLIVSSGNTTIRFVYSDESCICHPTKDLVLPETDISFTLTNENLEKVMAMGNILKLSHIKFYTDNGDVYIQAVNAEQFDSNTINVKIDTSDKDFSFHISRSNLNFIKGDYDVKYIESDENGIAVFTNKVNTDLVYITATENIEN